VNSHYQVLVIGGGLGGLVCANLLAKQGVSVCIVERKKYPFHRVCGEYVSNEIRDFLQKEELFPDHIGVSEINTFNLTSTNGKLASANLGLGGFGISRYSFDYSLAEKARANGVTIQTETIVDNVFFQDNLFRVAVGPDKEIYADVVVGSFGKRSNLDRKLNREFLNHSSPYIGVKYHLRIDIPENEISLHNFKGGYCGISRVENDIVNLCYLSERKNLKSSSGIQEMESKILQQNPYLKKIWNEAEFLFENPLVINEINFESKSPVEDHILMVGDSAGMIAPLCGNGMAIAIHSAKIASEEIVKYFQSNIKSRVNLEARYSSLWNYHFSTRLAVGRNLQSLFGSVLISNLSVNLLKYLKPLGNFLISKTHGKPV